MSGMTLFETPIIATIKSGVNAGKEVEVVGYDKSCGKFHFNWPHSSAVGWLDASELVLPSGFVFTEDSIVDASLDVHVPTDLKGDISPPAAADNRIFCEQIGNALLSLGRRETLSCMARMMAAIAQKEKVDLEFDCDIGTVTVERKIVHLNG